MKIFGILLFLTMTIGNLHSQNDNLEPAYLEKGYESQIWKMLTKDVKNNIETIYIVIPSFKPEYALIISKDTIGNNYLSYNYCTSNYWEASMFTKEKVEVTTQKVLINSELAEKIIELFKIVINGRKSPQEFTPKLDGITYYFALPESNGVYKIGTTWSPQKGTKMDKLISMIEELTKKIKCEQSNFESLEQIINNLIIELKE